MNSSIDTLAEIYDLFDKVTDRFPTACHKGCRYCCTCNLTATSLEIAYLFSRLDKGAVDGVKYRLAGSAPPSRYRPGLTTNEFARAVLAGSSDEQEENDPSWGQCPLLEEGRCSIYPARPFGCRSMMSETACRKTGFARMPPLALTINTIFLQYIEQLDAQGFSGNFSDLAALYLDRGRPLYLSLENIKNSDKKEVFVRNREIPALMVPPEHRKEVAEIVNRIRVLVQGANKY